MVVQDIEGRLVMVRELARQWFGLFMRPKAPLDTWLLQGLAGWLEGHYVKTYMGKNELAYRSTPFMQDKSTLLSISFAGHPSGPCIRYESFPLMSNELCKLLTPKLEVMMYYVGSRRLKSIFSG